MIRRQLETEGALKYWWNDKWTCSCLMSTSYFVLVAGDASGIYTSREEARSKCKIKSSEIQIQEFKTLQEAFSSFQSQKVLWQSQKSQNSSQINSQETKGNFNTSDAPVFHKEAGKCFEENDVRFQPRESTQRLAPRNSTNNFTANSSNPRRSPRTQKTRSRNTESKNKSSDEKSKETTEVLKVKTSKGDIRKTRNVCIQAERGPKCKCSSQSKPKTILIDNGVQTKTLARDESIQTNICSDFGGCVCCVATEVSNVCISLVDWDSLSTIRVPQLGRLKTSKTYLPVDSNPVNSVDWYLRQDWFTLTAHIPSSKLKRKKRCEQTSLASRKRSHASVIGAKKNILAKINRPGKGYKIPKKAKISNSGECEDLNESMDFDLFQCTQARLDDVTYTTRDIPHDGIGFDYEEIFSDYLSKSVTKVAVEDAYIQMNHQIQNLVRFANMLMKRTSLQKLELKTCRNIKNPEEQFTMLSELQHCLKETHGVQFLFYFDRRLHDRIVKFNNGWSVSLGRGLDYFQRSASLLDRNDMSLRKTRAFRVIIYKSAKF